MNLLTTTLSAAAMALWAIALYSQGQEIVRQHALTPTVAAVTAAGDLCAKAGSGNCAVDNAADLLIWAGIDQAGDQEALRSRWMITPAAAGFMRLRVAEPTPAERAALLRGSATADGEGSLILSLGGLDSLSVHHRREMLFIQ